MLKFLNMTYSKICFAKNFGSKYGKKFLHKGISASKRIKDTGNFIKKFSI